MSVTQKNTKKIKQGFFLILRIHFYNIAYFIFIIYIQIQVRIETSIFIIPWNPPLIFDKFSSTTCKFSISLSEHMILLF